MTQITMSKTILITLFGVFVGFYAFAESSTKVFYLTLENHVFTPKEIVIPANEKVKIIIHNKDNVAEEFDSFDLNRERVIFAGKKQPFTWDPYPPGNMNILVNFILTLLEALLL